MNKIINDVLLGKNDYMFLFQGAQREFDYLLQNRLISPSSVDSFVSNIQKRSLYFNKNNICYKHIVFPSKPLVKKNFLPDKYLSIFSLFDSFYKDKCSKIKDDILYPLDFLCKEEETYSTFLKLDTHMTARGYQSIVKSILTEWSIAFNNEIDEYMCDKLITGDLSRKLENQQNMESVLLIQKDRIYKTENKPYLPGNTNDVVIMHNKLVNSKRLLIFGDSFLRDMMPIFSFHFKDIMYVRSEFVHYDIVERYQPDYVITGNTERYLNNIKEEEKESNDFLLSKYGEEDYIPSQEYLVAFKACLSYKYYPHIYKSWVESI